MRLTAVVHKVATLVALGIGLVHTAGTFFIYDRFDDPAVWFAGAGLAVVFVALLNTVLWRTDSPSAIRWLAYIANLLFFAWLVTGVSATPDAGHILVASSGIVMVISAALSSSRR